MFTRKGDLVKGYEIVEKFRAGKNVFKVKKTNIYFVLKVLEGGIINEEIRIGVNLGFKCPFLVKIFDMMVNDDEMKDIFLVMEYCEGGDLAGRIESKSTPTDAEIYRFLYEGAEAIRILHEAGIIHRDIKPANFYMIKSGAFKLGDYGVACVFDAKRSRTMTRVGTDGYLSPEMLEGEKYDNKVDIYAFGITLLHFIIGRHPFSNDDGGLNMRRIMNGTPIDAALKHPHPCAKLALSMIAQNPADRPSAAEILSSHFPLLSPLNALQQQYDLLRGENNALKKQILSHGRSEGVSLRPEPPSLSGLMPVPVLSRNKIKMRAEIETLLLMFPLSYSYSASYSPCSSSTLLSSSSLSSPSFPSRLSPLLFLLPLSSPLRMLIHSRLLAVPPVYSSDTLLRIGQHYTQLSHAELCNLLGLMRSEGGDGYIYIRNAEHGNKRERYIVDLATVCTQFPALAEYTEPRVLKPRISGARTGAGAGAGADIDDEALADARAARGEMEKEKPWPQRLGAVCARVGEKYARYCAAYGARRELLRWMDSDSVKKERQTLVDRKKHTQMNVAMGGTGAGQGIRTGEAGGKAETKKLDDGNRLQGNVHLLVAALAQELRQLHADLEEALIAGVEEEERLGKGASHSGPQMDGTRILDISSTRSLQILLGYLHSGAVLPDFLVPPLKNDSVLLAHVRACSVKLNSDTSASASASTSASACGVGAGAGTREGDEDVAEVWFKKYLLPLENGRGDAVESLTTGISKEETNRLLEAYLELHGFSELDGVLKAGRFKTLLYFQINELVTKDNVRDIIEFCKKFKLNRLWRMFRGWWGVMSRL